MCIDDRVYEAFFHINSAEFEQVFMRPKPTLDSLLVVYCHYGIKARRICDLLAIHGPYQQVHLYQDGWQDWTTRMGIQTVRRLRDVQLDVSF